jgi:hypothetical protein
MFVNNLQAKSGIFCLLSLLFLIISFANCDNANITQQNLPVNKVNTINVNNKIKLSNVSDKQTHEATEAPASSSDKVGLRKNIPNLNSKYETKSSSVTSSSLGLFPGSKKSE